MGSLSYGAAALGFALLSVLLVASWRGRLPGVLLVAASVMTAAWAALLAYSPAPAPSLAAAMLEILRDTCWYLFLLVLLGYSLKAARALQRAALVLTAACVAAVLAVGYLSATAALRVSTAGILVKLIAALVGMVLVEQLYRNLDPLQRQRVRLLCLGVGALFVCDFYLYSDALLFRRINEDIWVARGFVYACVVPVLALSSSRNPDWSLDVAVSRRVVFHSAAVLGGAAYLLVMAAAGYYIRYFGGIWGPALQIVFVFAALQVLLLVFLSDSLRARLKVFLSKHFFSYGYDYREEWLRFTRALSDGPPGQLRERAIQAIAHLVHSPGGSLWLANDSGDFEAVATWNAQAPAHAEAPGDVLPRLLAGKQWVVNADEWRANRAAYGGAEPPAWLERAPSAWLIVPLMLHERLLGFVVLDRSKARIRTNWEVNDLLKTAGRQAASDLAQLEAARALVVARQFESFNRMSAFVVHDLKNLVAQLSLILSNAARHRDNPEFQQDMIDTVSHSVDKMKRLLFQLRGYSLEPAAPVELGEVLRHVAAEKASFAPAPQLDVREEGLTVVAHRARLERIIGHLVQNAIEATPREGRVMLQLSRSAGRALITIVDTGCGMSEQFRRSRLFQPFESTKVAGMGIGTYEAQQYIREMNGRIEVESKEALGSTFRLLLPLADAKPEARQANGAHG
ncbi:MAG: XrtA/PEP-CTERM system histidine kinase PrsK [Betaproteobacteria bacterium]